VSTDGYLLARVVKGSAGRLLLAAYRTRFIGEENVPSASGAILAGNHVSYLDPALLWCGSPRHTHFLAKSTLFEAGFLGWALPRVWAFPVKRGEPDRAAISTATELLKAGDLVGIFPEGTRKREPASDSELGEAQGGVAFIAMRAGVPVIPVGIAGTDRALPPGKKLPRFPRVTMLYAEPVYPEEFTEGGRKERVDAMTAEIMRRITAARDKAREAR
jgi:1-acyl-sn-glycerol-3-phosphate acyltransferase